MGHKGNLHLLSLAEGRRRSPDLETGAKVDAEAEHLGWRVGGGAEVDRALTGGEVKSVERFPTLSEALYHSPRDTR